MLSKQFDLIGYSDLELLKNNLVSESRTLEYKQELPTSADSSRIPFLSEICAFANTAGGDIILGITEDKGLVKELTGLSSIEDKDSLLLQLEQIIRSGLEPSLPNIRIKIIDGPNENCFIVIRVPKSWNSPHRVSYKDHSKFYGRNSAGKYPMDVTELRAAFLAAEDISSSARSFRIKRVEKLKAKTDLPVDLYPYGFLVLHIIPLLSLDNLSRIDVSNYREFVVQVPPISSSGGWSSKLNLDGVVTINYGSRDESSYGYTQVFRSGVIEAVGTLSHQKDNLIIASQGYEEESIKACKNYFSFLRSKDINPPAAVFLSLLDVRKHHFAVRETISWGRQPQPLDRNDLLLPEIMVDSLDADPAGLLKPAFDMIWQSFGYERSCNYDNEGRWIGQR